jgi:hypothetical protein
MSKTANFIKEITNTFGVGDISLAGAVEGYGTFANAFPTGGEIYYTISDGNNREVGLGTFNGTDSIARTTVLTTVFEGVYTEESPTPISLSGLALVGSCVEAAVFESAVDNCSSLSGASQILYDLTNALYINFDAKYLGAKSSDPAVDNEGEALQNGALYWNTVDARMKVYSSAAWVYISPTAAEQIAINTVSAIAADISAVVAIGTDVTTVALIDSEVVAVSGITSSVTAVAGSISNVNTTAGSIANVNTVAGSIANVNTVGAAVTNVNTTATNIASVNTVAGISGNITTVAGVAANVTTVAGISGNVTTVAGNTANVNMVAGNTTNINTVAGNTTNINTVAGISADVTTVAGIEADIASVITNMAAILDADSNALAAASSATNAASSASAAASSASAAASSASNAATSATTALNAQTAAEAARDQAYTANNIFPDTTTALGATVDGDYFSVYGTDVTYMTLYRNDAGVATELNSIYSSAKIESLDTVSTLSAVTQAAAIQQINARVSTPYIFPE